MPRISEGSTFDLDSSSVVRSLIGVFVIRSNLVSNFSFQKQSGIQSISTSLAQWWDFGISLIDREFEKEQ